MKKLAMSALVEVAELKNFYTPQSLESLKASIKEEGQKTPVFVSENNEIMSGYRIVDAMKELGEETVEVVIIEGKPSLSDYISRNHVREKTPDDKVKELRHLFERFRKRQGKRNPDGTPYSRDEKISEALKGRFKGDVIINKLEKVINNDLPGDILTKGIIENNWKVDTCHEFLTNWKQIDEEKKYGFTELLIKGVHSISEVNKFIQEKESLDQKFDYTFSIPDKITVWNEDCNEIDRLLNYEPILDLQFCSPPYWMLRDYKEGAKTDQIDENTNIAGDQNVIRQLGHEKTKEEYVENVSKVFKKVEAVLKDTGSVIVNIAETYIDGVGQGIPFLLRDAILRNTNLKFKDTFIWSKKNSRPQGEKVKRLQNSIEYIFWFVKDIEKCKYKVLTFPVEGKEAKLVSGAKDVNKNGKVSKKSKNISKNYGKLVSHLKEQELENIITTSIGKDHELYKIISTSHPAPMNLTLPVTFALMLSDEGDFCADIFGGSQVSGKIFTLLNRRYVSTEKSKEYFNIGCQRLLNAMNEFDRDSLDVINELVYENYNSESPSQKDQIKTAA
jgi:DNA modification methylase